MLVPVRLHDVTGTWSEAKLLYNGTLGAANQMEVAMAANGAVLVAMDVQTDSEAETVEGYELVYSYIGADGKASYPIRVTGDQISDTNVRVTSFTEGGKEKFLLASPALQRLAEISAPRPRTRM